MLNKEICKNCINTQNSNEKIPYFDDELLDFSWGENDEKSWEKGVVSCPVFDIENFDKTVSLGYSIKKKPPENCPYSLEHLMANQT